MRSRFVYLPSRKIVPAFAVIGVAIGAVIEAQSPASALAAAPVNQAPESESMAAPMASRPRDQLWAVNCRGLIHNDASADLSQLRYSVHDLVSGWSSVSEELFQRSAESSLATCVLVLGNGYTASQTQTLGQTAYRRLVAGLSPEQAVRFVIWSWPSDHVDTGPVKDLRIKAGRTALVAHSLARWLDEMESPGPVSLLGTSFGARIVMEALELRAGGRVGGLQLAGSSSMSRRPADVVLISAAIDNDWLLPGRRLDRSLSQVNRLLLINNTSDSVLKRYHWMYGRRSKVAALGATGLPAVNRLGPAAGKISQLDAASIIGRRHGCGPYFDSPRLVAAMRNHLFGERSNATPPLETPPLEGTPIPLASRVRSSAFRVPSSKFVNSEL